MSEYRGSVHFHVETPTFDQFRGNSHLPTASWIFNIELFRIVSIGMKMRGENSIFMGVNSFQYGGASPVGEYHGAGPTFITFVQCRGLDFSPDNQDALVHPGFDKLIGNGKPIKESRTGVAYVQGTYALQSQLSLEQNPVSRNKIIRSNGREYDEIDI